MNINFRVLAMAFGEVGGNDGDDICAICHEGLQRSTRMVVTMPCTHVYHWTCLTRWAKRSSTCPECRALLERLDEDVDSQYQSRHEPRAVNLARFGRGLLLQHRTEQAQNTAELLGVNTHPNLAAQLAPRAFAEQAYYAAEPWGADHDSFDPPRPRNADDATLREQANTPNYIMDEPAPAAPPANSQTRRRVSPRRPEGIDWRAGNESPRQRIGSAAETFGTVLESMTDVVLAAAGAGAAARGSPQISQSETTYLQHHWQQVRANACGPQELPPQSAQEADHDVVVEGDGDGWARVQQERALESHGAHDDVYEGAGWEPVDVGRAPVFDHEFHFAAPTRPVRPSRVCLSLADLTQADDLD